LFYCFFSIYCDVSFNNSDTNYSLRKSIVIILSIVITLINNTLVFSKVFIPIPDRSNNNHNNRNNNKDNRLSIPSWKSFLTLSTKTSKELFFHRQNNYNWLSRFRNSEKNMRRKIKKTAEETTMPTMEISILLRWLLFRWLKQQQSPTNSPFLFLETAVLKFPFSDYHICIYFCILYLSFLSLTFILNFLQTFCNESTEEPPFFEPYDIDNNMFFAFFSMNFTVC
jgi:hypothetical protein